MTSSELVDAPEAQRRLVEHDREEEAERERDQDDREREDERPDEDAQERLADQRVVEDGAEVREPDVRPPAGLELLARRGDERAPAVVAEDLAVLDPGERVGEPGRSGASARARARSRCPRRRIAPATPVGTVKLGELLVEREQLRRPGRSRSPRRRLDRAELAELSASPPRAARSSSCVPTNGFPSASSTSRSTSSPSSSRAGAITYARAVGGLAERVALDPLDRLALDEDVAGRPVREADVDVVDDRDDLERDQEDRARDQELERDRAPRREVDRVDRQRRGREHAERDPLLLGRRARCRPRPRAR